jgi:hypothetical protein
MTDHLRSARSRLAALLYRLSLLVEPSDPSGLSRSRLEALLNPPRMGWSHDTPAEWEFDPSGLPRPRNSWDN